MMKTYDHSESSSIETNKNIREFDTSISHICNESGYQITRKTNSKDGNSSKNYGKYNDLNIDPSHKHRKPLKNKCLNTKDIEHMKRKQKIYKSINESFEKEHQNSITANLFEERDFLFKNNRVETNQTRLS